MQKLSLNMKIMMGSSLLLLIACLLALFALDGQPRGKQLRWLHNAAGYQQAVYRAQQSGKPLLILLDRADCSRCQQLEQQLWQDPALLQGLEEWQLVRLQQDADAATALLVNRYKGSADLPLVILERTAEEARQPLYFNRELTEFSLANNPSRAAQPLSALRLLQALTQWLQQPVQSPIQAP